MPVSNLRCETCGEPAAGVCNVMLMQPMSVAYCRRCLDEGYEAWVVIVATVYACTIGYSVDPSTWRTAMAPWAVELIDRSLAFHQKTEEQLLAEVGADD